MGGPEKLLMHATKGKTYIGNHNDTAAVKR
jgi:hypothetical protein